MSSPSSYTLVDRVDDGDNTPNRRRESVTRLSNTGANVTSIRCSSPTIHSNDEHKLIQQNETSFNPDNFVLVFLDLHSQLSTNPISSLRLIINEVHTFNDIQACSKFVRFSSDRIFFVLTSNDKQILEEFHPVKAIEAIFIFNADAQIDNRFPKLYGVYSHYEQLLNGIKDTLEWYEQVQLEIFVFERDRVFLWLQLWRDEFLKVQKSKISPSNKNKLVELAEIFYRGNTKIQSSIKEFDQTYTKSDALQWCFSSIFPSYFLHHSLRCLNNEHLQACRFLLLDTTRAMQLSTKKTNCELYKGLKMTNDYLSKLENCVGRLICPKGYLQCTQSRKLALDQANSPDHRSDLMSVLIKITYDGSVPLVTFSNKNHVSTMIFDIYTVFRIKYVKRGQITTIKIEPADDDGKKLAREYRIEHEPETVQNLLNQLLSPPKLPARLPPLVPRSQRSLSVLSDLSPNEVSLSVIPETDDDESQAQDFVKNGQIDQAIEIYQRLKPESARILNIIGSLFGDKKGDYESAIVYYKKSLKIQEKNGDDVTNTLSQLGNAHQNRREFDLALACHTRALSKRKKTSNIDAVLIAVSLIGVANAHWGQRNFTEALKQAQQALTLNESIERGNDLNIASNLAILANIYHTSGDTNKALEMATRGLGILERLVPDDSPALAALLNNVATMQVAVGLLSDARKSFDRALSICKKSLPEGHPKRIAMENNIQRIIDMEQQAEEDDEGDNSNL